MATSDLKEQVLKRISIPAGLPRANPTSAAWQEPLHPTVASWQSAVLRAETDIAVIGSGITGCSVAYHVLHDATAAASTVTVLEARNAVSGATGRNGGHLLSDAVIMFADLVDAVGRQQADEILNFTEANIIRLAELVQQLSLADREAVELRIVTHTTGFDAVRFEAARKAAELAREALSKRTLTCDIISKEEAVKNCFFRDIEGGVSQTGGAALSPYRLFTAVFSSLLREFPDRFTLETNTPVTAIRYTEGLSHPYELSTPRGVIRAREVVHCTNGYTTHLLPSLAGKLFPFKGTMSRQSPGPSFPRVGDHTSWSLSTKTHYDAEAQTFCTGLYYAQQNAQTGDIWVGGENQRVSELLSDDDTFVSDVARDNILSVLPRIWRDAEPVGSSQVWSGIMGFTSDWMPIVGKVPSTISGRSGEGEWIAAGFSGHGMDKCWLTGEAIASLIVHGKTTKGFPKCYLIDDERFNRMSAEQAAESFCKVG